MKISGHKKTTLMVIESLNPGDVFKHGNSYFLLHSGKGSNEYPIIGIDLENGTSENFATNVKVNRVKAKLIIK